VQGDDETSAWIDDMEPLAVFGGSGEIVAVVVTPASARAAWAPVPKGKATIVDLPRCPR
jgi:hypothetical protein